MVETNYRVYAYTGRYPGSDSGEMCAPTQAHSFSSRYSLQRFIEIQYTLREESFIIVETWYKN